MQYKRFGDTWAVRMDRGEEIMACLTEMCGREEIPLAEVSAIGAVDEAVIGVLDLETQAYHQEKLETFMEITSLTGNITAMGGKPYIHLHATLADRNHAVHGGHVLSLRVGATCEMFVRMIDGRMDRVRNEELGINLWHF